MGRRAEHPLERDRRRSRPPRSGTGSRDRGAGPRPGPAGRPPRRRGPRSRGRRRTRRTARAAGAARCPPPSSSRWVPWRIAAPRRVYAAGTSPPRRWATRPSRRSSNRLTRVTCTAVRPVGVEGVQGDAVAEVVERCGEGGGRRPLVLVHGAAAGPRLARRAGDVEQDQDGEVAAAPQVVDVDGAVGRRAGQRRHPRLDGGVEVDVVALRLPVGAVEADAQPGQGPAQRVAVGHRHRRQVRRPGVTFAHRAPVVAVGTPAHVPLGIGAGTRRERRHGVGRFALRRRPGDRASAVRAGAAPVGRRVCTGRSCTAGAPRRPEQALQQAAEQPPTTDGARQQIADVLPVIVVGRLVELGQVADQRGSAQVPALVGGGLVAVCRCEEPPGPDRPEARGRVLERVPAARPCERGLGVREGRRRRHDR